MSTWVEHLLFFVARLWPHLVIPLVIWFVITLIGNFVISVDVRPDGEPPIHSLDDQGVPAETAERNTDKTSSRPLEKRVVAKYWTLGIFVLVTMAIGFVLRLLFIRRQMRAGNSMGDIRQWLPSTAKTGLLCGALAYGTLAAMIAIIQATMADEQKLPSWSEIPESIELIGFGLAYFMVLTGYFVAKEQIVNKP